MRIAVGGLSHESCTFSPLPTRLEDFSIVHDQALLSLVAPFVNQWPDISFVPLIYARALPGGIIYSDAYNLLKNELITRLKSSGPWDGIFLAMHGAMFVESMEDVEGSFLAEVRSIVGSKCLIAVSYDLHGNVSQRVIDNLDILTAYRTAPHTDWIETHKRACSLLIQSLTNQIRPIKSYIPVPITLPGERVMTIAEPATSLYAKIPDIIVREGLLDASILLGYTWADEPRSGASVICIGTDKKVVQQAARELAHSFWEARNDFNFSMVTGTVDECINIALEESEPGVFISDAGDNLTGGGVGDVPFVLDRLLHYRVPDAIFASLVDPQAVEKCKLAGCDSEVSLALGGKLDPIHGNPINVKGQVTKLKNIDDNNWHVIVQIDGVKVILTEKRTAFTSESQFTDLGIHLEDHAIVVIKLGYLFPELRQVARKSLLAFSPGAINPDIAQLSFRRIRRPIFPLDPDMAWTMKTTPFLDGD